MSKSALTTRSWAGGASVDGKMGTDSSFQRSLGIDHRKKISSIRLHRKYVKESGNVLTTPVYDGVRAPDSSLIFPGDTKIYQRTPAGVYSPFAQDVTNVKSGVYSRDRKKMYLPGEKTIHAINYAASTTLINLIDNPNFEHATTPVATWVALAGTTISSESVEKYAGSKSLKFVTTGANGGIYEDVSTPIDTTKQYTLQMRVKTTAGRMLKLVAGNVSGTAVAATGGWDLLTLTVTPSATNTKRVQLEVATASTVYVDNVIYAQTTLISSYFDGNVANDGSTTYRWNGDANLSPSTKLISNQNPTFIPNLVDKILDQNVVNTGTNAYTLLTSISELAVNKIAFKPDVEPYVRVSVYVIAKGTGDITATLHDQANNVVATAVLPNASVVAGQVNHIDFTSQVRMFAKPNPYEYHLHFTTNSGTTTLRTATANDLSKADLQTYASALIQGVYHPAGEFLQYVVIGNDNYIAAWEPITDAPTKAEYNPHRLKLPSEYKVLGFTEYKEYYAISAYKSVSSDAGDEFGANSTEGLIAFWDGASQGFAFFIKVEGGAFESPFTYNGFIYGYVNGVLHVTTGDVPVPVYEFPGLVDFKSTHGFKDDTHLKAPYKAMCVSANILQMAFPMQTANESIIPSVYSFGRKTKDYAESIVQDHIPSHGQKTVRFEAGTNVPKSGITYLGRFGKNTFMAWQTLDDNGAPVYGIDVLNSTNPFYDDGELSYLDIDNKATYKTKEAAQIYATYTELPGNATIQPFYKINGDSEYTFGDGSQLVHDSENKTFILQVNKPYRVIEYGVKLIASTDEANPGSPVMDSSTIIIETNATQGL